MVVYAKAKYVEGSAQKARLVADLVRGKRVDEALSILKFVNKRAAKSVSKVIVSASANARHNNDLSLDNLYVSEIFVNEAPVFKRGRAVSKGRYHQILKRNSHITVGVKEIDFQDDNKQVEAKKTKKKVINNSAKKEMKKENISKSKNTK